MNELSSPEFAVPPKLTEPEEPKQEEKKAEKEEEEKKIEAEKERVTEKEDEGKEDEGTKREPAEVVDKGKQREQEPEDLPPASPPGSPERTPAKLLKEKSRSHMPSPLSRDRVDYFVESEEGVSAEDPNSPVVEARQYLPDAEDLLQPRRPSLANKKSVSIADLKTYDDMPTSKPPPGRGPPFSAHLPQRSLPGEGRSNSESNFRTSKAVPKTSIVHGNSTSMIHYNDPQTVVPDPRPLNSPSMDQTLRERSRKLSLHLNKSDVTNEISEVAQETLELLDQFDAIFQDALTSM